MRKILLLSILNITLFSCQDKKISGTIIGYETDSVFLYKANNESTYDLAFLKSITVTNQEFTIDIDSLQTDFYCLSLQNAKRGEYPEDYAFLFIEPTKMHVDIRKGDNGKMRITATGSTIEDKYISFVDTRLREENRLISDSLDNLFFKAREVRDTAEMRRIKEFSIPYHEKARMKLKELINEEIEKDKGSIFALYLYQVYNFPRETLHTLDQIAAVRKYINSYDDMSKKSSFYNKIEEQLVRLEKCAISSEAPEITGVNTDGKTINLRDFRGKYVLVDFWSSGCYWCRLETPNLQKAYQDFKDKGFTILGVSSDYRESDWKRAIEEDKSYWDHMLLPKKNISPTMNEYCISGIPHIILVDPNGIIIAKDLRGDDIYNAIKENINKI